MAIDLLEDSEYAALSENRVGNDFVNGNENENYMYFSIVSRKEKERRAESDRDAVDRLWRIDDAFKDSCTYLQLRLRQLENAINSEMSKGASQVRMDRTVKPMIDWKTRYQNEIARLKCVEEEQRISKEDEEKKNLKLVTKVASAPPPMLDLPTEKGSDTNKYILYGVGGLVVVIVMVALLRR